MDEVKESGGTVILGNGKRTVLNNEVVEYIGLAERDINPHGHILGAIRKVADSDRRNIPVTIKVLNILNRPLWAVKPIHVPIH